MARPYPLIKPHALAAQMNEGRRLRIVDASWSLSGEDRRPDFEAARLPGAIFFDLEASSDSRDLPHMLPSAEVFGARMGAIGLSETDAIVVYDNIGLWSAPRVWWMLTSMGACDVQVLDGGLPGWRAAGLPVESGAAPDPRPRSFRPLPDPGMVATFDDVRRALNEGELVLDARPEPRFRGLAPEPRPGLRSGHMPGARSVPYSALLKEDGSLKDEDSLRELFAEAGVDLGRPLITTCGSGVTAALLSLALVALGAAPRLYDASWAEWGRPGGGPVATDG